MSRSWEEDGDEDYSNIWDYTGPEDKPDDPEIPESPTNHSVEDDGAPDGTVMVIDEDGVERELSKSKRFNP